MSVAPSDSIGVAILVMMLAAPSQAFANERSRTTLADFKRQHPCPTTGRPRGACPGWVVDHVVPLACGGVDHADNMQWQTKADAAAKDRLERKGCEKPPGLRGM